MQSSTACDAARNSHLQKIRPKAVQRVHFPRLSRAKLFTVSLTSCTELVVLVLRKILEQFMRWVVLTGGVLRR